MRMRRQLFRSHTPNSPIARLGALAQYILGAVSSLELYMSSSFWLLGVESHDFSHAEKERTACKAEQFTKIVTQNDNLGPS